MLILRQRGPPVAPSVDAPRARPVAIGIGFDPSRYDGLKQKILQRLETSVEAQRVAEARQIFDDACAAGEIVLPKGKYPVRPDQRSSILTACIMPQAGPAPACSAASRMRWWANLLDERND